MTSDDPIISEPVPPSPPANPLRRVALAILLLALVVFVLSIFMERRTPSSSQAQVQAYVVGIAPEVAGRVIEVNVTDNAAVESGQVLFRIDPARYEIAVAEAEAALARVGQTLGASTAQVDAVQARLVQAEASRDSTSEQLGRASELTRRGVYAQAKLDDAQLAFDQADAAVTAAEADLVSAQADLGPAGSDNPEFRIALAALERARLDLLKTAVLAPAAGVVTNLQLSIGQVVGVGQASMTFIDVGTVWINAAFKENSLERTAPGNRAEVLFDALPGTLFPARVESVGLGVSQTDTDPATGLPRMRGDTGWIQEAQRFPVRLVLDGGRPKGVRYGSQVTVVIYTGDHPVTNAWGSFWIRIMSVLTYVG